MEEEKPRVTIEGKNNGDAMNLNEEIRVSSGFDLGDVYEVRVLPGEEGECIILGGYHANGDIGEVEGGEVLSSTNGVDGEIVAKGKKLESRNFESSKIELGKPETLGTSGTKKPREIAKGEKGKSGLSSGGDEGGDGESQSRQKGVGKTEGLLTDDRYGDFRLERRGISGDIVSTKICGIDIDGSVMRSVSTKVLGTEFEMGDMVWAKVKSHPWWPGHLYNEASASSSVRRTRSDGHILVAFFGDSSYGWFDPDELIPYDPHYAEKSQQSTSRNFVRAVEESIDETSRRSALGLSCYCRNPYNFRPTDVPGYLAVDIADFEPGTVYSVSQIQNARDSFRPVETLSFIHKLATTPMGSDSSKSLDFIKIKAIALAFRRSIFEEFDETYAEAFGHKPVRPQLPPASTVKEPSRAPLSGPLVFADTLGGRKSSNKATKPKEQSKKDKYLFKRRDESGDLGTAKTSQGHTSPSSSTYEDGTSDLATSSYLFQKRNQAASSNDLAESPAVDQLATSGYAMTSQDTYTTGHILSSVPQHSESEAGDLYRISDKTIGIVTPNDACKLDTSGSLLKKEKKATKRSASELSSDKPEPKEKKLKKSRKAEKLKSLEHPESHSTVSGGAFSVNPAGLDLSKYDPTRESDPTQPASIRDDTQASHSKKDVQATNSLPQQVGLIPLVENWENEADIRQILADLHGVALNPFHGMERSGPSIARHFFLKFRSLVFLKSSSASPIPELEHGAEVADRPTEGSKTVSSLKPSKLSGRQGDPTKGERKRIPSERQEENAAKRAKKITDVKSLGAEKRALLKNPELQGSDGKSKVLAPRRPQLKPVQKAERLARVEEPTYLVMRYPPGSSLPSLVELKARFARFGPLDTSLSRVFHKTSTCRVAFLFKQDAHVAYRYAVGNKSTFSNVRFLLKPVAEPESQQLNPDPSSAVSRPAILAVPPQSVGQLKSILKKPSVGDESGGPGNGGGSTRAGRVRFNIGDEKRIGSNKGVLQVQMESRNEGASLSSSSCVAMDVNKNQRLLSSRPLEAPLRPLPQFVRPPINPQFQHTEMAPRNNFHENITTTTTASLPPPPLPPQPSANISQQMMSLLTMCHDVVTNVKSTLGYLPYHSL